MLRPLELRVWRGSGGEGAGAGSSRRTRSPNERPQRGNEGVMLSRGLEELAERLARTAVRSDPGTHADVAIVLGGAPRYRAPTAVTLWRSGAVALVWSVL